MKKLTETEICEHVKPGNKSTGVRAITRDMLEKINLSDVPEIVFGKDEHGRVTAETPAGKKLFHLDRFTPSAGSYTFKPSFAGSQVLMGRIGRKLHFSDGRWFV